MGTYIPSHAITPIIMFQYQRKSMFSSVPDEPPRANSTSGRPCGVPYKTRDVISYHGGRGPDTVTGKNQIYERHISRHTKKDIGKEKKRLAFDLIGQLSSPGHGGCAIQSHYSRK